MRLRFVALLAGTVALSLGTAGLFGQERAPYSAIVVFGTSLSDSGNAFALRGGTNTPPDYMLDPLLIPSRPLRARRASFQQRRHMGRAVRPFGAAGGQRSAGVRIRTA